MNNTYKLLVASAKKGHHSILFSPGLRIDENCRREIEYLFDNHLVSVRFVAITETRLAVAVSLNTPREIIKART